MDHGVVDGGGLAVVDAGLLVASLGRAIEPRVHPPQTVHSASIGGVRVIHDAVIDREGRVRFKVIGPITEQYWAETLQPLIEDLRRS